MFRYYQYCPVARACEILSDRWTLLIVRELLFGSRHFNELRRGLPRISRSLLVARLRHLEDNGVIERHTGPQPNGTEYILTKAGDDLADVIQHLGTWALNGYSPIRIVMSWIPRCFCGKCINGLTIVNSRADVLS